MAARFFLVPKIGDGATMPGIRAKYFADQGINHSTLYYGKEDVALVKADVTDEVAALIESNVDVVLFPADLNGKVSLAARESMQKRLAEMGIESGWIESTNNWREVLKHIERMCLLFGAVSGQITTRLFADDLKVDSYWNLVSLTQRNEMIAAWQAKGFNTSGITLLMPVGQVMKRMSDQVPTVLPYVSMIP